MEARRVAEKEIERREIGHQRPKDERNFDDGKPNPYRQVTNNNYYGEYNNDAKYVYGKRTPDIVAAADSLDRKKRTEKKKNYKPKNESGIFESVIII